MTRPHLYVSSMPQDVEIECPRCQGTCEVDAEGEGPNGPYEMPPQTCHTCNGRGTLEIEYLGEE